MNPKRAQKTAIPGASLGPLSIVLYDQLIQNISRADNALAHSRSEQCATEISHALGVIGYLRATLRQDANHKLQRFYTMLGEKLMEAQVRCSRQILSEVQKQLRERPGSVGHEEADAFTF